MKFFCAGLAALACSTPFRSIPGGEGASGAAGTSAGGAPGGGSGGVAGSGGTAGSAGTSGSAGAGSGSGGLAGTGGTGGTGPVGGSGGVAGSAGGGGSGGTAPVGGSGGSAGAGGLGGMGGTGSVGGSGGSAGSAGASGGGGASGTSGLCTEELPGFSCVKAGTFKLGSTESPTPEVCRDTDEALHTVTLTHAFWIQQTEVTQKQWKDVFDDVNPAYSDPNCANDCPVEHITWFEALHYANVLSKRDGFPPCYKLTDCNLSSPPGRTNNNGMVCTGVGINVTPPGTTLYDCKGYRLPTEAEWEVAYRAGTRTAFYNGASLAATCKGEPNAKVSELGWYSSNSDNQPHSVGGRAPNDFGLYDMAGNVSEWCWDQYAPDYGAPSQDPVGGTNAENQRVHRGGSFNGWARELRASERTWELTDVRITSIGLRLVRTVPPP